MGRTAYGAASASPPASTRTPTPFRDSSLWDSVTSRSALLRLGHRPGIPVPGSSAASGRDATHALAAPANAFDLPFQERTADPDSIAPLARLLRAGHVLVQSDLQYERYNTPRPRNLWDLVSGAAGLGEPVGFGPGAPNLTVADVQLEDELAEGAWFVGPATADGGFADAFTTDPDRLWREVLRRQGGDLAMVSTYLADPSLN